MKIFGSIAFIVAIGILSSSSMVANGAGLEGSRPPPPIVGDVEIFKSSPTVGEVLNLANAIPLLSHRVVLDKEGKQVAVPTEFKFNAITLMTLARDLEATKQVSRHYQDTLTTKQKEGDLPTPSKDASQKDWDAHAKAITAFREKLTAEMQTVFDSASMVQLGHIKETDLCLDGKPKQPLCDQKNDIPIDVLTALLPILDGAVEKH